MRGLLPLLGAAVFAAATAAPLTAQETRGFQPQATGQGSAAQEESKVALVIGNGAYDWSPLRNPVNDARSMSKELEGLGFKVIHVLDASNRGMKHAIREFGSELRRADVGLFYYAGHGIQASGRNYLIPVDAEINSEPEVEYESVDLGFVVAQMEAAGSALNIVILDACRNNPFAGSFRSAERGLTQVMAPTGTLIAYATAPGSVASDGDGDNGLYTQELLRFMRMPGLQVEEVFKQVRISLIQQTNGQQTPWESSSLVGDFAFAAAPPEPEPEPEPEPRPKTVAQAAAAASPPPQRETSSVTDAPAEATPAEAVRVEAQPLEVDAPAVPPPQPPAQPSAPALRDVTAAVDACVGILKSGDAQMFDEYFVTEAVQGSLKNLRQWVDSSSGREAERAGGAEEPQLSADGSRAVVDFEAELSWRHSFGGNRSRAVPLNATLDWTNGRWRIAGCGAAGKVKPLR